MILGKKWLRLNNIHVFRDQAWAEDSGLGITARAHRANLNSTITGHGSRILPKKALAARGWIAGTK